MQATKRVLSTFSLVMINVIAVDSLRTLPISAKLGFSLVFFYGLAALFFFVPISLVTAELATAYPNTGGIYVWVREAFGKRLAFVTIWLQWIYNVVWYPTILAFIAATLSYLFSPALANNKFYLMGTGLALFWLFTLLNCFGMRVSSLISTVGAIIGTLLPMIFIMLLGFLWLAEGHHSAQAVEWFPHPFQWNYFSLFTVVLFGLIGMEMSATHAEEVKSPARAYPRAIFYSTLLIISSLVLSSLAIVIVVPPNQLSMVSGLIDAYAIFFNAFHVPWMIPLLTIFIILGALSCVSAWLIGPTKGLVIAARDGFLPAQLSKMNRHGAPVPLLIIQGIIFTLLSSLFILLDTVNEAYFILSDLCAQLALIVYLFMFAAAIKLRYSQSEKARPYKLPGGKKGMWLVAGSGFLCCFLAIIIGFIPPQQVPIHHYLFFQSFLSFGLILFIALPLILSRKKKAY